MPLFVYIAPLNILWARKINIFRYLGFMSEMKKNKIIYFILKVLPDGE